MYEVFERMAYCGISANLILYLTTKLHQGTVTAANNVTYWIGAIWMTPILGAYFADAHLGRYWTFLIACAIYLTVRLFLLYQPLLQLSYYFLNEFFFFIFLFYIMNNEFST